MKIKTSHTDKLILLGDFNARVCTDNLTWIGVIESEGICKCNSNGLLLLSKCQPKNPTCDHKARKLQRLDVSKLRLETSFPKRYLQSFGCSATQFRGSKRELNSLSKCGLYSTFRKHQYWFDENGEEIGGLLEEKHRLHKSHQDDTSFVSKKAAYNICKTAQSRLRDMAEQKR